MIDKKDLDIDKETENCRKKSMEFFTCLIYLLFCLASKEPDCKIPIKSWVVFYLFYRIFRIFHFIDFTYKPLAQIIIVTIFELFELTWLMIGNYKFFFSNENTCLRYRNIPNSTPKEIEEAKLNYNKVSKNFLYLTMLTMCLFGSSYKFF